MPYSILLTIWCIILQPIDRLIDENMGVLSRILGKEMAIPDFTVFCNTLRSMYEKCADNKDGQVACYIPQLARYSPGMGWHQRIWCKKTSLASQMAEIVLRKNSNNIYKTYTGLNIVLLGFWKCIAWNPSN